MLILGLLSLSVWAAAPLKAGTFYRTSTCSDAPDITIYDANTTCTIGTTIAACEPAPDSDVAAYMKTECVDDITAHAKTKLGPAPWYGMSTHFSPTCTGPALFTTVVRLGKCFDGQIHEALPSGGVKTSSYDNEYCNGTLTGTATTDLKEVCTPVFFIGVKTGLINAGIEAVPSLMLIGAVMAAIILTMM